ncbi:MAG: FHA domain-containing protein [Gammaproteobacteria bacterium]|nr:FHA domain-containing protein [Gammaproteobacteria bacterium]
MAAKLIVSFNNEVVSDCQLDKETMTIGRKPDNDIQVENLAVSGKHCQIITILNDSFLEDLGSTNGTYVNGKLVKKHALQNNDVIALGKHTLKYVAEQQAAPNDDFEKTMIIRPDAKGMPVSEPADKELDAKVQKIATGLRAEGPVSSAGKQGTLQLVSGANAGKELKLVKALTTIGKPGVQVAAITKRPKGYFLIHVDGGPDNSRLPVINGTAVGTQAVALSDHDVIEIAGVKMEFYTQ